MTKSTFTKFVCDTCQKEIFEEDDKGFPYEKGWMYVHNFNGQVGKEGSHKLAKSVGRFDAKDKHFCCAKCCYGFVGKTVIGARESEPVSTPHGDWQDDNRHPDER
jgi:hypothetical protein